MKTGMLEIKGISRRFGETVALDNLSLEIEPGELVALLGPSGCGKTTALRIVAGLERADAGTVILKSKDVTNTPAHHRNMGMVFQAYSLFPNLNSQENVAFGLQMRKVSKSKRIQKANELLELVGLNSHARRFPHQLSGGQQQRVALARALAFEPEILLLDEPLSALDAQVRANLREEIRRLQLSLGTTTLFVTHDQEEAMAISDRVGVMNKGKLEQIAAPDFIYNNPSTPFVAGFVGSINKIRGTLFGGKVSILGKEVPSMTKDVPNGSVIAYVRPESILVERNENIPNAKVVTRSFLGANSRVTCETNEGVLIHSAISSTLSGNLHPGDSVLISVTQSEVIVASV